VDKIPETDFHIFVRGWVDKYLGGAAACFGRGVVATPRKAKETSSQGAFHVNKICFLGLHGKI
jgi:hypothetical protein